MSIWKRHATVDDLNAFSQNTLSVALGIKITEIGERTLTATMPVMEATKQPMGFLHGGASAALAETLGSIAASLCTEDSNICFGLELNASHLKSKRSGEVTGVATPIRIGSSVQVWEIRITDETNELVCLSRLTVAVRKMS
ncbi:hotdog fold thioesterase [Gynuella sunshinyii]|uniref:Uncharacterized protein, possibly involved in aromatic compounds catabolism n=1 Tax=Gynuella sunshinyii YC6258 TaxID=1445510 RepID=A0A0C5VCT2_9GAMM|nr:hotdog fold thioesterase [Gynuella sunshinyii]AJQ97145.1 uncharacterized protein, possibly involved in aromatic compounds catabolism [Gynuella sunshinyii YC6258]